MNFKKITFPTPYTVLMIVIVLSVILTHLLPAGKYDTLTYDKVNNSFVITETDSIYTIPASQEALDKRNILISVEKFKEEKIKKPISIPNTYQYLNTDTSSDKKGSRFWHSVKESVSQIVFAPIKGIYESIDVILFVLVLGGFISVFNSSGALNMGVGYLSHYLKGREGIMIILLSIFLALGGTSFGLAEETMAFYPMLVPIFLAAGYDLMVPLAVIYVGSNVGSMASTTNPFAVIIASDAAGVDWTDGLYIRLVALIVCITISVIYIIKYAERVRKNPESSLAFGAKIPEIYSSKPVKVVENLSLLTKLQLLIFGASFVLMVIGVSQWDWWFQEMTALFLVSSIVIAILQHTGEEAFITSFVAGARDLLGVAFIIGIARGVSLILNEGNISGTILYYATDIVGGMSPMVFLPMLMFIFALLSLFISSSSGMAVLTMPIIGSLASVVGVEGYSIVNAYLFGMGLMGFITPTGMILPSLTMVNVNFKQWLKFCMPLVLLLTVVSIILLWI